MAQITHSGNESAIGLAESGKLHKGQKHGNSSSGTNRCRNITAEQKQRIRELYAETKNGFEVARMMGLSKTAVYKHLELNNRRRRWTDKEDQKVIDGYLEKRPVKEIAQAVGRTSRAVMLYMHRHRKKVRGNKKLRRALSAITLAFKAARKADIFREVDD